MDSRKFKLLFPHAIMLHFKTKNGQIYYYYNDTFEDIRTSTLLWENVICPTILGLNIKEVEIWKNEQKGYKINTLYKIEEKLDIEPDSLHWEEFETLFPNYSITHFVTKISEKTYYYGDGEYLSLYSYIFWRARRKVASLDMDEQGMSMWRQDKLNFLRNWRNYYESSPSSPSFAKKPKSWVERFLRWGFKGEPEKKIQEEIRSVNYMIEMLQDKKLEVFVRIVVIPLAIIGVIVGAIVMIRK